MKTPHHLRALLLSLSVLTLATLTTGCASSSAAKKFAEFERLGIVHAQITGKFSNTTYTVEEKDGKRQARIDHSNAWMPKVVIIRETPAGKN